MRNQLLLFFTLLFLSQAIMAQKFLYLDEQLEKLASNAETIIEATSTGIQFTYQLDGGLATSTLYQVNQVFKGKFEDRYVELLSSGGSTGHIIESVSHGIRSSAEKGRAGIFCVNNANIVKKEGQLGHAVMWPCSSILPSRPSSHYSQGGRPSAELHIYQKLEKLTGVDRRFVRTSTHIHERTPYSQWAGVNYFPGSDTLLALNAKFVSAIDTASSDVFVQIDISAVNSCVSIDKLSFNFNYDTASFEISDRLKSRYPFRICRDVEKRECYVSSSFLNQYSTQVVFIEPGVLKVSVESNSKRISFKEVCPPTSLQVIRIPLELKLALPKYTRNPQLDSIQLYRYDAKTREIVTTRSLALSNSGNLRSIYSPKCLLTPVLFKDFDIDSLTSETHVYTLYGRNFCEYTVPTIPVQFRNSRTIRNLPLDRSHIIERADTFIRFTVPAQLNGRYNGKYVEGDTVAGDTYLRNGHEEVSQHSRGYVRLQLRPRD